MVDTKQQDDKKLVDYSKRFKQVNKIFTVAIGKNALDEFVKCTKCHTAEGVRKEAHERWMVQVFMKNTDQHKCGKMMNNLKEQCALGHDQ